MCTLNAQLYLGDCFEWLKTLPDASVDFVCSDLPYGTTRASWDYKVDLSALWQELKRVIKPKAYVALFASGKQSFALANSNFKEFRYRYCWNKCGHVSMPWAANQRPLMSSEDILLFCTGQGTYNPQRGDSPWGGGAIKSSDIAG